MGRKWNCRGVKQHLVAQAQERQAAPSELRHLQKRQESAGRCLTEAVKQLALARRVAQGRSKAA
jgi:hypothetical protein